MRPIRHCWWYLMWKPYENLCTTYQKRWIVVPIYQVIPEQELGIHRESKVHQACISTSPNSCEVETIRVIVSYSVKITLWSRPFMDYFLV